MIEYPFPSHASANLAKSQSKIARSLNYYEYKTYSGLSFKNILIPYDNSPCADRSFRVALDLAKKYDSHITLITCIELPSVGIRLSEDLQMMKSVSQKLRETAGRNLGKLISEATKEGVLADFEIKETKSVVKTLVSIAQSHAPDLIVMGSHGRTGLSKFILGSVANGVCQLVNCPILIVK